MNKINKSITFIDLSIFVNVLMIFFGSYLVNLYVLQALSCLLAIFSCYKQKIIIKKDTILWLLACLVSIFSIFISEEKQSTIQIAAMINMVIIIKIVYENNITGWQKKFITMITIASGVHVLATIAQLILPNFITSINSKILSANNFQVNQEFYKRGAYAGITAQTGINAFFIAIFIGTIFSKIVLKNEKRNLNIIFLILALVALFMTGKRGILLFTALSVIFVFFYTIRKDKKNFFKYIILASIIIGIGYIALINIPETKIVFEKMEKLEESDNILNGREYLWAESIKIFSQNPAFGIGEGNIAGILGDASHNIYIQLLAETGIIGFSIYCLAFLCSLIAAIKKAKKIFIQENNDLKNILILSIFIQILFITYGFTGNPLYSNIFLTPYIISIAMVNGIKIEESEEKNENRDNNLS